MAGWWLASKVKSGDLRRSSRVIATQPAATFRQLVAGTTTSPAVHIRPSAVGPTTPPAAHLRQSAAGAPTPPAVTLRQSAVDTPTQPAVHFRQSAAGRSTKPVLKGRQSVAGLARMRPDRIAGKVHRASTAKPPQPNRTAVNSRWPFLLHNSQMITLFGNGLSLEVDHETCHQGGVGYTRGRID